MSDRQRKAWRAAAWGGLVALIGARAVIDALGLDPATAFVWSEAITYLFPMLLVAVVCAALSFLFRSTIEQRFWGLLSAASVSLFIGETYWDWYAYTVDPRGPLFDGAYKYFQVAAAVLFMALLVTMTQAGERKAALRARIFIDAGAGMVIAYSFAYAYWVLPSLDGFAGQVGLAAWVAAWPVFGVAISLVVLAIIAGYKAVRWRPWERLAAVSHAVFAVGLVLFPVYYPQLLQSTALEATWYSAILGAGLYLLCVAAIYRLTSGQAEALAQPWPVRPQGPVWLRRVYPVALVAALPLIGWKAHLLSADGQGAPLLGAAVILATLLGLRSWLAALETAHHRLGSVTDPLTGAYNGAYVGRRLGTVVGGGETTHGRACLVVTRIDDFSRIDQVHGREAGDEVLRGCAGLMRTAAGGARSELFRVHDAEFLELLLEGDTSAGVAYATRLNGLIQEEREQTSGARFSISCGVTELEPGETDWQQVLERARDAASVAADEGGERIRVFTSADVRADRLAHDPRGRDLRSAMFELAKAADARDPYAAEHSARVERLAVLLASDLGMREEVLEAVRCAALLHDIGKIGVSMRVLSKPAALSADERAAVERHCELGERLLRASGLADVAVFVRHHHERWDGEGYPDRLVATDIPLEARLISVCDALETLTAPRPYRNALTLEQALCEIEDSSGSRYDPELAQRLVAILRSSDLPPLDFRPQPLENEATAS